ncbi:uncharacterized protein F4822DRAFT_423509 [Hypoxylon trugodes]|uniref:uncharacterized protein n=1 Tax=Hypoxylon trugodes TaxID=326681 RepID=UPI0021A06B05|nr:uncharacterized protein F4822DRAFT_423509 [Hypoxylon trugodes]KAI1382540.1 hypothetical protein F4822DRAFT_423509 [Hypoxylon trugodes]
MKRVHGRLDHLREHCRNYHLEDIPRQRAVYPEKHRIDRCSVYSWWRCAKCLRRVNGSWTCLEWNTVCDCFRKEL